MILVLLAISWLVGIVLADGLHLPFWPLLCAASLLAGGALAVRRVSVLRLACLALCFVGLGAARMVAAEFHETSRSVQQFNGSGALVVQGVVSEDPQRTETGQRVVLMAEFVARDGGRSPVDGLVLVNLPPYPERRYGDRLQLTGELNAPRGPKRLGEFDYAQYLARKRIFALMQPKAVSFVNQSGGQVVLAALLGLRDNARRVLMRELPEPESSLAVGILLGIQSSISPDVYATFSATGTSHILVISGWNISIIAAALYGLAARFKLSRDAAFWAILGTIWLYTLFVGATPTVIRAAVMGTIVVIAKRTDREAHAWTTLFAACMVMTAINPQWLWDMGFQLSALATASLFAFGKGTERLLDRTFLRAAWLDWAREALTATLAAQILALPLILYSFGNLSVIAPLANVVLLPVVPAAMLFGALALVAGLVWLPAGQLVALPAYLFLAWLTEGARFFAGLPFAAVQVPPFSIWLLLGYYVIVLGLRFVRLPNGDRRSGDEWTADDPRLGYSTGAGGGGR